MNICYHSIVIFGMKEKHLGLSNSSYIESLERFRVTVVDNVKTDICLLKEGYHSKENKLKI